MHVLERQTSLGRREVQPPCQIRSTDILNEVRVAAHDELVTGTRQTYVEALTGAFERRLLVDDEHDGAPLEAFETEDVALEHLIGVPKAVPVGGVAGCLAFLLLGMAGTGGQQRDVLGPPSLLEEQFDLVVAAVHGVVTSAGDELHGGTLAAEEAHRVVDQWLERVGDLAGVPEVVVEDQRDERHRWRSVPVEDALAFVGERVNAAGLVILECGQKRVPPGRQPRSTHSSLAHGRSDCAYRSANSGPPISASSTRQPAQCE